MLEQWEYRVDKMNLAVKAVEDSVKVFDERGLDGWELVVAYREGPFFFAIFKRKVRN